MKIDIKIIFLFLIVSAFLKAQSGLISIPNYSSDSNITTKIPNNNEYLLITDTTYNLIGDVWEYQGANNYSYNSSGLLEERSMRSFENNSWGNYYKYTYYYYVDGQIQTLLIQSGLDSDWLNDTKFEYEYNLDSRLSTFTSYHWSGTEWVLGQRVIYTYLLNGDLESRLTENWKNDHWDNYSLDNFYYNYQERKTERIYQFWVDSLSNWVNQFRHIISYDEYDREIELMGYNWIEGNWEMSGGKNLTTYYNLTNLISEFKSVVWYDSVWENNSRYVNNYNSNDLPYEKVYQYWGLNDWNNTDRELYEYDENNNQILVTFQNWSYYNSWITRGKTASFYQLFTDSPNENKYLNSYSLSQTFPNPFNPSTSISYQIPEMNFVTIKIYDVLGNEIATLVNEEKPAGTYKITWNAEGLSSGIYFYRLQAGNFVATKKMILLK